MALAIRDEAINAKDGSVNAVFHELLSSGIYKRTQGRIARQATFAALAITFALGCWQLSEHWKEESPVMRFAIPGCMLLVGLWFSYRVVNLPRFADFLIAVEAEMNKVSWPSRQELFRSSMVVLITIFLLATVLFLYDLLWNFLLMDLLQIGGPPPPPK